MQLDSAQLIDHKYKLLHTLGTGAFGDVWLAQDTVLGDHHVAIKFLTDISADEDKAFLVEMRALAGLNLPGIVAFHHHFRHQNQLALVMAHCAGGSLLQRLRWATRRCAGLGQSSGGLATSAVRHAGCRSCAGLGTS